MSLVVVDHPADRPLFIRETLDLIAAELERERARLVECVAAATDAELAAGTDADWGVGQVATHLLIVERGVIHIALRLARGEPPGPTGQPRPAPSAVSREGIAALVEKVHRAHERLRAEFPAEPSVDATAPSPYFGPLNCFGWLLTLPNHYAAHLAAFDRGAKSAL